jgi:hypothetical protein
MLGLSELHLLGGIHDWFPDWAIGVLLAFGGCTLSNFGAPRPLLVLPDVMLALVLTLVLLVLV